MWGAQQVYERFYSYWYRERVFFLGAGRAIAHYTFRKSNGSNYAFRGKRFSIPILGLAFRTLHSEIVLGASVDRLVYVIHHCRTVGEVSTVAQAGWLGGNRSSEVVIEANDS